MPKKPTEQSNPILDHLIETLEIISHGELTPREPHFGTAPRCRTDDVGIFMGAVFYLGKMRDENAELRRALTSERQAHDDTRKRLDKAQRLTLDAPPAAAKKKPATAPPAAGKPCKDHDWNTDVTPPVCKLCGKTKSNRGRKSISNPAANVTVATVEGVTKVDPPSQPLPGIIAPAKGGGATPRRVSVELEGGATVDADDDPFAGGTVGAR